MIRFGFAFLILDIDTWVALPRGFVDAVATARLTGSAKVMVTNLTKVVESNPFGVATHICQNIFNRSYIEIVSLLVSISRGEYLKEAVL